MADLNLPPIHLQLATPQPPQLGVDTREIKFVISNESETIRYDWFNGQEYYLSFSHAPAAIDLSRVVNNQCMFLIGHRGWGEECIIGQVTTAEIVKNELVTTHRIGGNDDANEYWADAERGVIPGVSIECQVKKIEVVTPATFKEVSVDGYTRKELVEPAHLSAVEWELLAVSSVAIPALIGAKAIDSNDYHDYPAIVKCDRLTGYEFLMNQSLESTIDTQFGSDDPSLNMQLADQNKSIAALQTETARLTLANKYWQLRATAIDLYALQNRLTQDDFAIDFTEDPQADIDRLALLSPEGSKVELLAIERDLIRCAKKEPIQRLSKETERTLVANRKLSAVPSGDPNAVDDQSNADNYLARYKPRSI